MTKEISFIEYIDKVDSAMLEMWKIDTTDAGIEFDELAEAQEDGWTPQQYAKWFGEKHRLTPVARMNGKIMFRQYPE